MGLSAVNWRSLSLVFSVVGFAMTSTDEAPRAEPLASALSAAYENNPNLNAIRAELRAIDEALPQAKSGFRPRVDGSADIGKQITVSRFENGNEVSSETNPAGFGVTVTQDLFRGFRTTNAIREAKSQIYAGRARLVNEEQNTLLDAVTAYMDVVANSAVVRLNAQNVEVLRQQLRQTVDRFDVGEVTRTDVAQAEASLSASISLLLQAQSELESSQAIYREVVGRNPRRLRAPGKFPFSIPASSDAAVSTALAGHPAIQSADFTVEASEFAVKEVVGELLPTVSVEARAQRRFNPSSTIDIQDSASITGRLTVPIYQQGVVSSRVRQSKQTRDQRRLEADAIRRQVRRAVVAAWAGYQSALGQIRSDREQIRAAQLALEGVRQEEQVGQRTTLDVLDAQQVLLNAQVDLTSSERNRVVAAYSLLSAMGRLTANTLNLRVARYNPEVNTKAVQDKWFGLRLPNGN